MDSAHRIVQGIGVSPGIAIGKAYVLARARIVVPQTNLLGDDSLDEECARFEAAVSKAEQDLEALKQRVHPDFKEHIKLLEVHQLILRDRLIYGATLQLIRQERINAQWALVRSLDKAHERFTTLDDEYIRSRVADVDAVGERVLRNLAGGEDDPLKGIRERVILVSHDLSPADAAQLQFDRTLGLLTEMGGRTSHTSIVARSLNIPAIVGADQVTGLVKTGEVIIIDGTTGRVVLNPSEDEITQYTKRQEELENYFRQISRLAHLPARTMDGYSVKVEANIELIEEIVAVKDNGAEGIGLYRTEFSFMNRTDLPDEEALYNDYRELAELMAPLWVTLRTLDLGADKLSTWFPKLEEMNPALGLRSIRLCLHYPELFKTQLRAILRATAAAKNIRLMFPMVSGVAELHKARKVLREVQDELRAGGIAFDARMPVGVMIEVPSAVAVADLLSREVDFFSIGTNDLIQYSMGIDRANEHVAYLYEPLHPAVLRFIKQTVDAGHRAGISVSLCGEMAGETLYVPILLGLQLDSLSMNPQAVPRVKHLICRSLLKDCRRLVKKALQLSTAEEISAEVQETLQHLFPEELRVMEPDLELAHAALRRKMQLGRDRFKN